MKFIDVNDLEYWCGQPQSKFDLPWLVSRLVRSTTPVVCSLIIPKGKSIFRGGWDGKTITSSISEFVPEGLSLWEFGTEPHPSGKAERDYYKRTNEPLGENISQATFVFVTPRIWEKKETWIQEKIKENRWKDVKVIDGAILVEWLLTSYIQSHELANLIGKQITSGLESAEQFWENWSIGPKQLKLSPKLVTGGRNKEVEALFQNLKNHKEIIPVQASTKDEAIAFFVAATLQLEKNNQEELLAKCIIVEDYNDFKTLILNNTPLIIIPRFINFGAFHNAIFKGHHILLPLGADDKYDSDSKIILPKIGREEIIAGLQELGLSEDKAKVLSKETGRNITIIKRQLGFDGLRPEWAQKTNFADIIPALLVGKWDELREGDRQIIEHIANQPYDHYITKLKKWVIAPDSPVLNIGTKWQLASPLDAWIYLSQYVSKPQLEYLRESFLVACNEIKPSLSLEADQRYLASFYGKIADYSKSIREGLTQSLIILGLYGESYQLPLSLPSQIWVDRIIFQLCENQDDDLWKSLNDILPLVAEASPSSFLTALEAFLRTNPDELQKIFEEAGTPMFSTYYHTGLLWALEGLAWLPAYLSRVTYALLELDTLDPDIKIQNRPINSLRLIFLTWLPQTFATVLERKEVIQAIQLRQPDRAWDLCVILMPSSSNTVAHMNNKLRWRHFDQDYRGAATYQEINDFNTFLVNTLISLCEVRSNRILMLLDDLEYLSFSDRKLILDYIKQVLTSIFDDEGLIRNKLRKILHYTNSRRKSEATLLPEDIATIKEFYDYLKPSKITDALIWVFNTNWPEFPDGFDRNKIPFNEREKYMQEKRNKALSEIYIDNSFDQFLALIPQVSEPGIFGHTASQINLTEFEKVQFLMLVNSEDDKVLLAVKSFIRRMSFDKPISETLQGYNDISEKLSLKGCINFLLALPSSYEVWLFVKNQDEDIIAGYWSICQTNSWEKNIEHQEYQILQLLNHKRFYSALEVCSYNKEILTTQTIIEILKKIATEESKDLIQIDHYQLQTTLEELYERTDCDEGELAKLEWLYIDLFNRSSNKPKILHKELSSNPSFFIDMICFIYQPNDGDTAEEEIKGLEEGFVINRAKSAYKLLDSWDLVPGLRYLDGKPVLEAISLNSWVEQVRELAKQKDRLNKADLFIGKILAQFPEADEIWPPEPIAQIIDSMPSEALRSNFRIGISNKRSFSSRGPFDGGQRERNLATYFRRHSAGYKTKYPITAAILETVAKGYDADAKREDDEARENDLEY